LTIRRSYSREHGVAPRPRAKPKREPNRRSLLHLVENTIHIRLGPHDDARRVAIELLRGRHGAETAIVEFTVLVLEEDQGRGESPLGGRGGGEEGGAGGTEDRANHVGGSG
jgi:hypothetical protein